MDRWVGGWGALLSSQRRAGRTYAPYRPRPAGEGRPFLVSLQ